MHKFVFLLHTPAVNPICWQYMVHEVGTMVGVGVAVGVEVGVVTGTVVGVGVPTGPLGEFPDILIPPAIFRVIVAVLSELETVIVFADEGSPLCFENITGARPVIVIDWEIAEFSANVGASHVPVKSRIVVLLKRHTPHEESDLPAML